MKIIEFDTIDSTQKYLKSLDIEKNKDLVVFARYQNEGRGRTGNEWLSPDGGAWFSFVYDVSKMDIEKIPLLTLEVGKILLITCKKYYGNNIELKIKYPNDLFLNGKKVAGIICELVNENRVIIGIGVNTNFSVSKIKKLQEKATTFIDETTIKVDNEKFMKDIIKGIKKRLLLFDK